MVETIELNEIEKDNFLAYFKKQLPGIASQVTNTVWTNGMLHVNFLASTSDIDIRQFNRLLNHWLIKEGKKPYESDLVFVFDTEKEQSIAVDVKTISFVEAETDKTCKVLIQSDTEYNKVIIINESAFNFKTRVYIY